MRVNHPVSQKAFEIPEGVTLMSTTDLDSRITYANAAFASVSGFGAHELHGEPHNIVRHPDMPQEVFADMWRTLQGGESWTGIVKNRRKNGEHYWVRANATPVLRDGRIVGLMSVRTKPSHDEVREAEALYEGFRTGSRARQLFKGVALRTGLRGCLNWRRTMSVRWCIRLCLLSLFLAVLLGIGATGVDTPASLGLLGIVAIATLLVLWVAERQVIEPLCQLAEHARRVAAGESTQVDMDRVDEIGMAMRSINQVGLLFRWLIDDVSQQVLTVQSASVEIAQGGKDLNVRTVQSAASVEKSASALEMINQSAQRNASAAKQAAELATAVRRVAQDGGPSVERVTATMTAIADASGRIADISGLIDDIAFQTNILALNAAVEAARAGESGQGFAVVAGQVHTLAQSSAQAAREIKALIHANVERVEDGEREVGKASRTIAEIVSQVGRVANLIDEISQATQEQSKGISDVASGIGLLDSVTQQNSVLVGQSAVAAQDLANQIDRLVAAVRIFRAPALKTPKR